MDQHEGLQRDQINAGTPPNNNSSAAPVPNPPIQEGRPPESGETPQSLGQWFAQNGPTLIIAVIGAALLFMYFDPWTIIKVALGLSFVIFIHELGHFLVAKWCDVHVTTFSIGFGPAIPGCSVQWGETTYKLALLPLGGYVQMVGQVDGEEGSDGSEDDPRSYRNKSVGQRMAIISAGVIMNVILAMACFVVVFLGPGKDRQAAVVAYVDTGAPAFKQGVSTGAEILQIGNIENPFFEDLMRRVIATGSGEALDLVAKKPGDNPELKIQIVPRKTREDTRPVIGIAPSDRLQLATRARIADPEMTGPFLPRSPAAHENSFTFGDRIIATTDPDQPDRIKDLPDDPRYPNHGQCDYFEFARRMQRLAGKEVTIRVLRGKGKEKVDVKVPPAFHLSLGMRMHMGQISAVRDDSPAAKAGIQARDLAANSKGDLIEKVTFEGADGPVTLEGETLDPLRLPYQLRSEMAKLPGSQAKKVTLLLRRQRAEAGPANLEIPVELEWKEEWSYDRDVPLGPTSPWAIPELGLAYVVKTTVADVSGPGPKDNPLQPWDEIKEIRVTYFNPKGGEEKSPWNKMESDEQWASAFWGVFESPQPIKAISLRVERNKEIKEVDLEPVPDTTWPLVERGWIFMKDVRRQKADNIVEAVALGFQDTHNNMLQVFQTLKGMITNRLSVKNLGGPIMIANVAYKIAGYDFGEFVFFLGLISVNLAVINFLPIPVLDGGHMVFLVYEKIRGQPASEGVRIGATYAGLALILGLVIFVSYLDISRLFW